MWLWISLTVAIVFLYIADKESIVTLVIYALTASLLIFGYINIKRGLNYSDPEKSDSTEFTFAVDANNLLGLVEWDLKKFSDFIDELEKDLENEIQVNPVIEEKSIEESRSNNQVDSFQDQSSYELFLANIPESKDITDDLITQIDTSNLDDKSKLIGKEIVLIWIRMDF